MSNYSYEKLRDISEKLKDAEKWYNMKDEPQAYIGEERIRWVDSRLSLKRWGVEAFPAASVTVHYSPVGINEAILEMIAQDESLIIRAIDILRKRRNKALIECNKFCEELSEEIKRAKDD